MSSRPYVACDILQSFQYSQCARVRPSDVENECYINNDKVYAFMKAARTFGLAQKQCQSFGGSLVKIGNDDESLNENLASIAGYDGAW